MAFSKAFHPFAVIHDLKRTIVSIREQWRSTRRENERLRQEREEWRERATRLERERDHLREENERLKRQLDEAQRAAKRQAAPFARGMRNPNPQRPGRKPGAAYWRRHRKPKPKPDRINEVIAVPAPGRCACGGSLAFEKIASQYQHDIVRQTVWKRFDVTICRCTVCHQRVHGR